MKNSQAPVVKVVLVDDSELVRTGLRTLLSSERSIQIIGEAGTVADGIATLAKARPNVALLDIRLPDGTGFDICRQSLAKNSELRVLFLTSVVDDKLVDEAISSGGHGYLLKEINGQGLIRAIHDVAAGKSILDPAVTERVMRLAKSGPAQPNPLEQLSPQERRVLALTAEGKTNKEVGLDLGLSEKTVKNYLANIFAKLNVTTRTQAAALHLTWRDQTKTPA